MSDNPKLVDTTTSTPRPKNAVPPPASADYKVRERSFVPVCLVCVRGCCCCFLFLGRGEWGVFASLSVVQGYYLCAGKVSNMASDGKLLAGVLGPSPNGKPTCMISKSFGIGGLSSMLRPGQYQALVGEECQVTVDDDF